MISKIIPSIVPFKSELYWNGQWAGFAPDAIRPGTRPNLALNTCFYELLSPGSRAAFKGTPGGPSTTPGRCCMAS